MSHRQSVWSVVVAGFVFMSAAVVAQAAAAAAASPEELARRANSLLGLRSSDVVSLALPAAPGEAFQIDLPFDGATYDLALRPYSVRAAGVTAVAIGAGRVATPIDPGTPRTLRGAVDGLDDSLVAASLLEDGLYAMILLPDGERIWVEPIAGRVAGAAADQHVVYHQHDVLPSGQQCLALRVPGQAAPAPGPSGSGNVAGFVPFYVGELGCIADVEYFNDYDTTDATIAQMETVINSMNAQYEAEVGITHQITTFIVHTAEPDDLDSSDPGTLLNEFRNEYAYSDYADGWDVAELFTGKDMSGGVIGIAWLSGVCSTYGYNVVQSDFTSSFGCKTDLSAHELGHNWGAGHCDCPSHTMNPYITCTNTFHPTLTIPSINAFRESAECVDFEDIILSFDIAGPVTIDESSTVQFTASIDFQINGPTDVTTEVVWSADPVEAGTLLPGGLYVTPDLAADTPVTITATYTYFGNEYVTTLDVTVVDLDGPDSRVVQVELTPSVDPAELCAGQSFTVDLSVSSPDGDVPDVRHLQFDTTLSSGVAVDSFEWDLQGLVDDVQYYLDSSADIPSAAYAGLSGIPGEIVVLTAAPQVVGRVHLTFPGGAGTLNVCGDPNPPTSDESVRFQSGFLDIDEFTQALGNVSCVTLALTEGDCVIAITASDPPNGAIDARQPSDPDGTDPDGWSVVELTFDGDPSFLTPADFATTELGGDGLAPSVDSVTPIGGNAVKVALAGAIEPGAWTTLSHTASGTSVQLGYLPADVDGDGTSAAQDLLALIDHLNGVVIRPFYSTDIDRSGVVGATDVLREIDLLNGAGVYDPWIGVSLP